MIYDINNNDNDNNIKAADYKSEITYENIFLNKTITFNSWPVVYWYNFEDCNATLR